MITIDGKPAKVGDVVCFKCDVEQCGRIESIHNGTGSAGILRLRATSDSGFEGEYIGGQQVTAQRAIDCWIE